MSNETQQLVLDTIIKLEYVEKDKFEIDRLWAEIKTLFLDEMASLPDFPVANDKKMNKNTEGGINFGIVNWQTFGSGHVRLKRTT